MLDKVIIKGVSFSLIEHEGFHNGAEVFLEFVFCEGKGEEVGKLNLGDDLLFFELVFHFVNFNRRINCFIFLK